jgi:quinol monooxygenase YgiN
MLYTVTYFEVQPKFADEAGRSMESYRRSCSKAAGNTQTEVLREHARSNRFVVLETWSSEQAFQAHESGDEAQRFRQGLQLFESAPFDQRVHQGLVLTPGAKTAGSGSLYAVTHIDVPPPRKDETEILLKKISAQAINDAGNLRYDVLQQISRPNHFTTISVWDGESSFFAHTAASHTREFRRTLAPMSGGLYDERLYGL